MKHPLKPRHDIDTFFKGIVNGDRIILGQSLTLMESTLSADEKLASALLEKITPFTGKAIRIGITGIPGVGKSTFIEALGKHVLSQSKKLAVLSIDPSSPMSSGSILGDKTRMDTLSKDVRAFIRPTASGQSSGGVATRTRECMLLCEAAGYDVIVVETVGVGQSEVAVKNMVDFFLLLLLAGAGDELQGMKKGIIELADGVVITKSDGANREASLKAQAVYANALALLSPTTTHWQPVVMTSSAYTGEGIGAVWEMIQKYYSEAGTTGSLERNRKLQNVSWFHAFFSELLKNDMKSNHALQTLQKELEAEVASSRVPARLAATKLFKEYLRSVHDR